MDIKPQDEILIDKNKFLIRSLQDIQDTYCVTLCSELGLTKRGAEWLFDYLFNDQESASFASYLKTHNCKDRMYLAD